MSNEQWRAKDQTLALWHTRHTMGHIFWKFGIWYCTVYTYIHTVVVEWSMDCYFYDCPRGEKKTATFMTVRDRDKKITASMILTFVTQLTCVVLWQPAMRNIRCYMIKYENSSIQPAWIGSNLCRTLHWSKKYISPWNIRSQITPNSRWQSKEDPNMGRLQQAQMTKCSKSLSTNRCPRTTRVNPDVSLYPDPVFCLDAGMLPDLSNLFVLVQLLVLLVEVEESEEVFTDWNCLVLVLFWRRFFNFPKHWVGANM